MPEDCGEMMVWSPMLERDRWYKIEAHVRVNTISGGRGNNDGVLEGWIDDQLAFRRTNLRFRDVSNLKIESIWANIYMGGNWVAERNMAIHFDNMVVARNRIGGGSSSLPAPPTGLRIISSGSQHGIPRILRSGADYHAPPCRWSRRAVWCPTQRARSRFRTPSPQLPSRGRIGSVCWS